MATNSLATNMTLLEIVNRLDPNGNSAKIIEVLNQTNAILADAPWREANGGTVHTVKRRASLGDGTSGVRRFNEGTGKTNSKVSSFKVSLSMFEKRHEIDCDLIDIYGNKEEARMQEALATIEELGQQFTSYVLYGDSSDDELGFKGLANELSALSDARVYGCGGTGSDLTSIFLVQWGENKTHLVYPKNMPNAGVQHEDLGKILVTEENDSTNTKKFQAYVDLFKMKGALCISDPRSVARICNIETSSALDATSPSTTYTIDPAKISYALANMINQVGSANMGSGAVIYAPRIVYAQMQVYALANPGKGFMYSNPFTSEGKTVGFGMLSYMGIPIRLTEQISVTETALT